MPIHPHVTPEPRISTLARKSTPYKPEELSEIALRFNQPRLLPADWKAATSFQDLQALTLQSMQCEYDIRGDGSFWFDEVIEILPDLIVANSGPWLTVYSQPGGVLSSGRVQYGFVQVLVPTDDRILGLLPRPDWLTVEVRDWSDGSEFEFLSSRHERSGNWYSPPNTVSHLEMLHRRTSPGLVADLVTSTRLVTLTDSGRPHGGRRLWSLLSCRLLAG